MSKIMPNICVPKGCGLLIPKSGRPAVRTYTERVLTNGGIARDVWTNSGIIQDNLRVRFPDVKIPKQKSGGIFATVADKVKTTIDGAKRRLTGPSHQEIGNAYSQSIDALFSRLEAERKGDLASINHYKQVENITEKESWDLRKQRNQAPIPRLKLFIEKLGITRFHSI